MNGNKKGYGPRAKGTALRITVLDNGRGKIIRWLEIAVRSSQERSDTEQMKRRLRSRSITHGFRDRTTAIQRKKGGERENNNKRRVQQIIIIIEKSNGENIKY
jgi:hypothetical protein